jgi:hypothetical protein
MFIREMVLREPNDYALALVSVDQLRDRRYGHCRRVARTATTARRADARDQGRAWKEIGQLLDTSPVAVARASDRTSDQPLTAITCIMPMVASLLVLMNIAHECMTMRGQR